MATLPQGTRLGPYEIKSHIGTGGMGDVYLAEDTRLGRKIALKLLPADLTDNKGRLKRFEQEARAASALNHPNILTIHEIGNSDGNHFIATEFIDGQTLRQHLIVEQLTFGEAIEIAVQIASALEAAHAAGIVHRDIKPENIMLRRDAIVKVLDFGLAKLGEQRDGLGFSDPDAQTVQLIRTHPGAVLGTIDYMSPEQARGQPVDQRTDIWSLGVVLYEMVLGHRPFRGETPSDVLAAILTTEPAALQSQSGVPDELQRIVKKTLRSRRDERYQTIKELLVDLKNLKNDLQFAEKLNRATGESSYVSTGQIPTVPSSAFTVQRFSLRHALIALPVLALVIGSIWWFLGRRGTAIVSPSSLNSVEVVSWKSTPGELYSTGTFSPDGKMIAFVSTQSGTKNIWVKQTTAGEAVQVTKDDYRYDSPIWSPDGDQLAFFSTRGDQNGIWRMPAFGGTPQLIKALPERGGKPIYWSKKDTIYYEFKQNLFALDLKSGGVNQLTKLDPVRVNPYSLNISPDEERIAYVRIAEDGSNNLWLQPAQGGAAVKVTHGSLELRNTVWHPDSKRILYSGNVNGTYQVFVVDADGNRPVQITLGEKDSFVLDVSRDGSRILYGSTKEESDIWGMDLPRGEEFAFASDISSELWPNVSPDGKNIAFQSVKNLSQGDKISSGAILSKTVDSTAAPFQLAASGSLPVWAPDGKQLAFLRFLGDTFNLWTVRATGGEERQVTTAGVNSVDYSLLPYNRVQASDFSWSPKSSTIAYCSAKSGKQNVWTVSADGSNDTQITANDDPNLFVYCPLWSSDGSRIAYSSSPDVIPAGGKLIYNVSVIDTETKSSRVIFESESFLRLLGWSPDEKSLVLARLEGKARTGSPTEVSLIQVSLETGEQRSIADLELAYLYNIHLSADRGTIAFTAHRDGKDNLWVVPVTRGEARRLTNNSDPKLYFSSLSWSPHGNTIYFGKQSRHSLLSMITNFK